MGMFTFKEFLQEMDAVEDDVEDLSAEDLNARAVALKKQAQLKHSGRGEQANKMALRTLQQRAREAKDPRQRADLQRRIKELMASKGSEDEIM